MDIPQQLRDIYRFPGLLPAARLRAYPGDPDAIILTLRRRRKKRFVATVSNLIVASTINVHG